MADEDPRAPTRSELAQFLPNQRSIRAFEKLFDLVPSDLISLKKLAEESSIKANTGIAKAQQALDQLSDLESRTVYTAVNYTTAGNELVKATAAVTITLNLTPKDKEKVIVKRDTTAGRVTVSGLIDDDTFYMMLADQESKTFIYDGENAVWMIT